jgi:uncharacterized protein YcbK (DUF882 family)
MRLPSSPGRCAVALLGLTWAVTASAQPPARGTAKTTLAKSASAPSKVASTSAVGGPRGALAATSAAALAYMAGRQPLVGLHAPSERSLLRDAAGHPELALFTVNRAESLAIRASGDEGGFDAADLDRVAHLLRSAGGEEHPIDPRTLAIVYRIQSRFQVPEIRVVSGYRTPKPGSHSNHGKGRAMDIIVPGVPDLEVAQFARDMGFVGVGVYPTSQFVHVDIRPRSYFWVDYSGPHMKNRESGILGDLAARSDAAALARGQAPIEPFGLVTDVDQALRARGVAASAVADEEEDEEN